MKTFIQSTTIAIFCLLALNLNAQKFGYINSQELIQEIPEVKEATSNLETFQQQLAKQGQDMLQRLQTKYQELEQKQASGDISPKQLEVEFATLQQEEQKLVEFQGQSQQQIASKQNELLSPILEKVQAAIDEVAAAENYVYVFDSSQGMILYADDSTDISTKVKAKLGL